MNIFVLDKDPATAAQYHTDSHVVKMILESAQMMSTTVRLSGVETDIAYKIAHKNHPCTIWTRQSLTNWRWLGSLAHYLNEEYKYRFGHIKNHKSYDVISKLPWPDIPDIGLTYFAQAMPDIYRIEKDSVQSYRNYYLNEKKHLFKWTKRSQPFWIENSNI